MPYSQRRHLLGDEAENIWLAAHPLGKTTRFGWHRPLDQDGKEIKTYKMPLLLRHMPDFYADIGALVEVVGCGRDNVLKSLKPDKYEGLKQWKKICDRNNIQLYVFVWNSHAEQYVLLEWADVVVLVQAAKRRGVEKFSDGNEFYSIPWEEVKGKGAFVGSWNTN